MGWTQHFRHGPQVSDPVEAFSLALQTNYACSARSGFLKHNGNHKYNDDDTRDTYQIADLAAEIDSHADFDLSAIPGIVNIPICDWKEIQANWKKGITKDNEDTYPCNGK